MTAPVIRALFQKRIGGDDALLELARRRFEEAGLAAEVYADNADELSWVLTYAPAAATPPVVHLSRGINLLVPRDREKVEQLAVRFAGRVDGFVAHDRAPMADRIDDLAEAVSYLDGRFRSLPGPPRLWLEYAAGLDPGRFLAVAERLAPIPTAGICLDVGHVGIRAARTTFGHRHPGLDVTTLTTTDPRLPELVDDVQAAVRSALGTVLDLIRGLALLGGPLHFHLHDGHPLRPGLADHASFLTRLPVPFAFGGRRSLDLLYGAGGLEAIVTTAAETRGPQGASFTLEIHDPPGRLPVDDARDLFRHWRDTTNAERMNHWLDVLSQNGMLVANVLSRVAEG